jgi:hypothetical protein
MKKTLVISWNPLNLEDIKRAEKEKMRAENKGLTLTGGLYSSFKCTLIYKNL